ncbi:unnamed protein product [Mytilus coruscus]|uniref:CCHC-type domain-containing protein n=1 Tax=Mytilus coruscus TaxID=42192 RepID=A0A6J8E5H5_MYTCO|nr:unnamed protein product [Mytilus coruscus]
MEIKDIRGTVLFVIGISTEKVQAISVIRAIEHVTGLNSVLAVVKDDSSSYDVTLDSKPNAAKILSGVEILDKRLRMFVGKTTKYYKCVHNNQTKVCSECLSPEHVHKHCPYIICNGCGAEGHVARRCRSAKCEHCHELPLKCKCQKGDNLKTRPQPIIAKCNDCDKIVCSCVKDVNNVEDTGVKNMSNTQEETNNEVSEPTELKSDDVPESEGLVDDIHKNKNELIIEVVVHVDNVVQHETRKRKIANSDDNCSESDENIDEDVKDDDEVEISTPSVSAVEEEKKMKNW